MMMMMSLPSGMNGLSTSQGYGFGVPRKAVAMPAKPTEAEDNKEAVALQQAATQHRTNATLAGLATVVAVPTVGLGVSEFAYRNGLDKKLKYAGPTAESLVDKAKIEADVRAELAPKLTALQEQELASQRTPILTEAQNIAGNPHAQTIEGAIEFH